MQTVGILNNNQFSEVLAGHTSDNHVVTSVLFSTVTYTLFLQALVDFEQQKHQKGRPAITIPETQLALLLEHHFTLADIARMLQVSPRTVRRRIIQYGLEEEASYSELTDSQLDEITRNFVHEHPYSGLRSYGGFLRSAGLRIQQT